MLFVRMFPWPRHIAALAGYSLTWYQKHQKTTVMIRKNHNEKDCKEML